MKLLSATVLVLVGAIKAANAEQIRYGVNVSPETQICLNAEPKFEGGELYYDEAVKSDAGFIKLNKACDDADPNQNFTFFDDGSIRFGVTPPNDEGPLCISSAKVSDNNPAPSLRLVYCKVRNGLVKPNGNQKWTMPSTNGNAIEKLDYDQCIYRAGKTLEDVSVPSCSANLAETSKQWEYGTFPKFNRVGETFPRTCEGSTSGSGLGAGEDCESNSDCASCCCFNVGGDYHPSWKTCVHETPPELEQYYGTCEKEDPPVPGVP